MVLQMFSSALSLRHTPSSSSSSSSTSASTSQYTYSRLPTSPTTSISSLDSDGSLISTSPTIVNRRMSVHHHDDAESSSSSSSRSTMSFDEKRRDLESGSGSDTDDCDLHDDEYHHGRDRRYTESRALLGMGPIRVPLPSRWIAHLPTPVVSVLSRRSERGRSSSSRKGKSKALLVPTIGVTLVVLTILGAGYLLLGESLPFSTTVVSEVDSTLEEFEEYLPPPSSLDDVPEWAINSRVIPDDPTHVLIPPHSPEPVRILQPIHDRLPYPVLEDYFTSGRLPSSYVATEEETMELDRVYLFVNASSPYLERAMAERAELEGVKTKGKKRHWRDNGELRGAVRSGVKGLSSTPGKVHIVSADWPVSQQDYEDFKDSGVLEGEDGDGHVERSWRIGQIPHWLDWESQVSEEEAREIRWHFHSDIFRLPASDNGQIPTRNESDIIRRYDEERGEEVAIDVSVNWNNEQEWKDLALPSFNSFAIESRLGWLEGLSENFIAFNDDMFILRDLSSSDFRHPLLGNVLRLDDGLMVSPLFDGATQTSDGGEWGALNHAAVLLSRRFPEKKRGYMHHLPKTVSKSILHEASVMFQDELSLATTRGFRESQRGGGDVEMAWLTTHMRIERWREALLWSWAVAKIGGVDGRWGESARAELKEILGMQEGEGDEKDHVNLSRGPRKTLEDIDGINAQVGWEGPRASDYIFSSMDGHLPNEPNKPGFAEDAVCTFKFDQCLPPSFFTNASTPISADGMFAHLAFARPECGDCLISALVRKSGERGLDAFLPSKEQIYHSSARDNSTRAGWRRSEPILPMVNDWRIADFSLGANVRSGQDVWQGAERRSDGGVELRRWCIKLLSRYNYIYGGTASLFAPIHTSTQILSTLDRVDASPDLALFCMNDDLVDSTSLRAVQARAKFGEWMEGRFGDFEAPWERAGIDWFDPEDRDVDLDSHQSRADDQDSLLPSRVVGADLPGSRKEVVSANGNGAIDWDWQGGESGVHGRQEEIDWEALYESGQDATW
ncbi:hypothetical protein I317_00295 [Kwoniella heveanensis CBS 569]|nr:hypothetical protein I317_00295 [Kwoniella heveanensis CBS 569]